MEHESRSLLGFTVRALRPDLDCDEHDRERHIPVGTVGLIERLNHIDAHNRRHYDVAWSNGAWTVYSEAEVRAYLQIVG
jgi:hypothetical protein